MVVYLYFFLLFMAFLVPAYYSGNKLTRYGSRKYIYVLLLLFLGLRYGIGTDYFHYEHSFQAIKAGADFYITEPIYFIMNKFFCLINFESMVFFIAFLTIHLFFKSVENDKKPLNILLFVFLLYIPSFTLMRQVLAIIFVIYGFSKNDSKKELQWLLLASCIHKSMWILTFLYLVTKKLKVSWYFSFIVCIIFAIFFGLSNIGIDVIEKIIKCTPYAYYSNTIHLLANRHFGILSLLQLLYEICFFLYNKTSMNNKRNSFVNLLFMMMICSELVGIRILIFATRVTFVFYPAFFISTVSAKKKNKFLAYIGLFLAFLVFCGKLINEGHWDNVVPYKNILF